MLSEFLKRLMFARQFSMADGKIEILGLSQVMFPMNVLKQIGRLEGRNAYRIFKDGMKKDFSLYSSASGLTDDGIVKNLPNIFEVMGLGELCVVDLNRERCSAVVKVLDEEFTSKYDQHDKICHTIVAGTIAGIFSYIFEKDVDCSEVQCMAFGYEYCEFVVKEGLKE